MNSNNCVDMMSCVFVFVFHGFGPSAFSLTNLANEAAVSFRNHLVSHLVIHLWSLSCHVNLTCME